MREADDLLVVNPGQGRESVPLVVPPVVGVLSVEAENFPLSYRLWAGGSMLISSIVVNARHIN